MSMVAAPWAMSFSTALSKVSGSILRRCGREVGHLEVVGEERGDAGEIGDGRVVALEEEVVHLAVGEGVEEDGAGGLAVASGAADLLVVGLDGCRGARCGRRCGRRPCRCPCRRRWWRRRRRACRLRKCALHALAGAWVEAGVVGGGAEVRREFGGELFGGFARGGVDDGGAVGLGREELGGELVATWLGDLDDLDGEVVAAKAVDEALGLRELELRDDVVLHGGGGGGGEGDDGRGAQGREESPSMR